MNAKIRPRAPVQDERPPIALEARPRRRRATAAPVGAVVIGGDYQGLGIVRSLGRRNIPAGVIDDERSIARFSRYASWAVRVPDLRDEDRSLDALLRLHRRLGLDGWVLFPTREETVAALSRHGDLMRSCFRVPTPDWDVTRWAWDKRNTYELAARLGIPVPRTWRPADLAALRRDPPPLPVVIKPAIKERFVRATGQKAWVAASREELEDLFARATAVTGTGGTMLQEFVPGGGESQFAYCALFKEGRPLATMVARRVRQHPADFGKASTFAQTVDVPVLEQLSERFLRAIGYYGLVEIEYKRDARTGEYKLLDVNARTWGYHTLGQRAGVDFPYLLFLDQLGQPVAARRARPGVSWVRLLTDLPTAAVDWRDGRLGLLDYLRSIASVRTEAVFSLRDPLPFLAEFALVPYLYRQRGF